MPSDPVTPEDIHAAIERVRSEVRTYQQRLHEAYDKVRSIELSGRTDVRRRCPRCGYGAFRMITGTVEGAECLKCGKTTSLHRRQSSRARRSGAGSGH
jgi:ribosomal protein S27AE